MSILVQTGRYIPGESAEQWRGEGHCEALPLTDIIEVVPDYTVSHMVASRRIELEDSGKQVSIITLVFVDIEPVSHCELCRVRCTALT